MKFTNIFFNSNFFTKDNKNLDLFDLIKKAAFFHQDSAGIYSTLSLGFILEDKVNKIITEELENIGFSKIRLSNLQSSELWKNTGRFDLYGDELFKVNNRKQTQFVLSATAEEQITQIVKDYYNYTSTDLKLFQIGNKYRDELRTKSGLIRAKEFLMSDSYHFSNDYSKIKETYLKVKEAYIRIFNKLGIKFEIVSSDVGEIGGNYSEEFRCLSSFGEDSVKEDKYLEIAHIFDLGNRYSKDLELKSNSNDFVHMSCFGIGVSRLIMALLEQRKDDFGFFGDKFFNTFDFIITAIDYKNITKEADFLYKTLKENGFNVLLDDRDISAGKKFNDSELIAVNERLIISKNSILNNSYEILKRKDFSKKIITLEELLSLKK
jgi:prolyl-tRNA synthetase